MAIVGLDGSWIEVNDALCRIVGYAHEELLSRTFVDITHPDDIDVDRLLNSLTVVDDPAGRGRAVGMYEKGLSALESLLFAKYQMYRNVYWHHAVRSATCIARSAFSVFLSKLSMPKPSPVASTLH